MSRSFSTTDSSLEALEFPAVLALVAELASTDLGRERIRELRPVTGAQLAGRRCGLEEISRLEGEGALLPQLSVDLRPLLADLGRPQPDVDGKALLRWARVLAVSSEVRARVLGVGDLVELNAIVADLPDLCWLAEQIERALDERGRVRDDASRALAKLRRRVNTLRQEVYSSLRGALDARRSSFTEDTIPLHNGRLMLMLKSGDRGRSQGLVHGRSSRGRSLYFEPLEAVEGNNALQEAIGEEEAERRRILRELRELLLGEIEALREHAEALVRIDALQAAWRFGETCSGRLAELSEEDLVIVGGRHPLLDPATRELRRAALGSSGHEGEVTPLDLELDRRTRVLVITGPNAGGKTVAAKTVGLLAALNQSGLPVPVEAGTRLPEFDALVAVVGDEQDLMRDRSTFSGRLLRLKEAWDAAGPSALILLDELGSGTDPDEGAALGQALIERLAATRSTALVTTHLLELASAGLELEHVGCAAMEFDRESGRPTYRLFPGPPGASEAIALARQLELPEDWLDRATSLVGSEHRTLRRMLAEVDALRSEVEAERIELSRGRAAAAAERAEATRERQELVDERSALALRQKRELAKFRRKVKAQLNQEVERLREELASGQRRGLANAAAERLFEGAPDLEVDLDTGVVRVGERVCHIEYEWQGVVQRIRGDRAEVRVNGKRVQCDVVTLRPTAASVEVAQRRTWVEVRHEPRDVARELKLIGRRVESALEELDRYIDRAVVAGLSEVRIVHGHGSGRLRRAVREFLEEHPSTVSHRPGGSNEGGDGATVVRLQS